MLQFDQMIPQDFSYYYTSTALSESDMRIDMADLWVELSKHIMEERTAGSWNRILFECWCSKGYLIAYPHKRGDSPDHRKPRIIVGFDLLKPMVEKMEQSIDETDYFNLHSLAYIAVRSPLRNVIRKSPAKEAVILLLESTDFTASTMVNDNVETLMPIQIFF